MSDPVRRAAAGIWAITVDRPVATFMIAVGAAVFGFLSYNQLPLALMPELSYPTLTIRTEYEGAAPEEVEAEITKPLEEFLRTVEGVRAIKSTSRAGLSDVVLEFQWNTDMDFASQRVRERVDIITFPDASDRPLTLRYDPDLDPIMRLGVSGEADLAALRTFSTDEIARALEKVGGVAIVKVHGGREQIVRVDLNQRRLAQLGLGIDEVRQRLSSENVNLAGGEIEEGGVRYLVRTLNEFEDLEELRRMSVGLRDGELIRLGDVGRVYLDYKEREVITRIDGRESVEIEIFKEADANIVQIASSVRDKLFGSEAQRAWIDARDKGQLPSQQRKEVEKEKKQGDDQKNSARDREKAMQIQMTDFVAYDLPDKIKMELLSDQSTFIKNAIDEVVSTALLGGLCAILILYLFLRSPTSTLIIGIAIPLSVVVTFALMRMVGVSLNIMSLGGLALGVGMLVDNSIVVLESIYRCREEGDNMRDGAIRGAREVGSAVTASTLTTTAVFFPIVFVEGVAGQLFGDLALTVVFSLLASLVVALFVVPMMATWRPGSLSGIGAKVETGPDMTFWQRWKRFESFELTRGDFSRLAGRMRERGTVGKLLWLPFEALYVVYALIRGLLLLAVEIVFAKIVWPLIALTLLAIKWLMVGVGMVLKVLLWPLLWLFDKAFEGLAKIYPKILRGALNQRLVIVVLAGLTFTGGMWTLQALGMELIPQLHQGEFRAEVRMPIGTALEDTASEVAEIETALESVGELERLSSFVGAEKTSTTEGDRGEHSGTVHVRLEKARDIEAQELRVMDSVRTLLSERAGVQFELVRPTLFTLQTPIQVEVRGHDLRLLKLYSDRIAEVMATMPELTDIRAGLRSGYPEVQIRFDRDRLSSVGLQIRQVAEVVQSKVRGSEASELRRDERRLDILVRVRRADVETVRDLENLIIGQRTAGGQATVLDPAALAASGGLSAGQTPVLLGQVADIKIEEGPSEIRHLDGQRAAVIEANTVGLDLATIIARVEGRLSNVKLPRGFTVTVGGQSGEIEQARTSLLMALLLAIFLVYIVMASQFESIVAPLVIIFTIPLAAVGVAVALWWTNTPLSVVVFIGMIMLAGIVVNNAIVLVDYAIQLRERGTPHREALVEACTVRLRPVLITTLTTVLGLLPMALGLGEGAEIRAPMALTVIAGLLSSTALTLLVIPVVYDLIGGKAGGRNTDTSEDVAEQTQRL